MAAPAGGAGLADVLADAPADLPADTQLGTPANTPADAHPAKMRELERQAIERTLVAVDGNVSAAARRLGISRNTIYRRRAQPA